MNLLPTTRYLNDVEVESVVIEVHVCPWCGGTFGIDGSFVEQVSNVVTCIMCAEEIQLEEPNDGRVK